MIIVFLFIIIPLSCLKGTGFDGARLFNINRLAIHSLAIKISCYQPPVLIAIQTFAIKLNSFTINSVAIIFICYQASLAIQPQLLSTHLLSSLTCYQSSVAIKNFEINHLLS